MSNIRNNVAFAVQPPAPCLCQCETMLTILSVFSGLAGASTCAMNLVGLTGKTRIAYARSNGLTRVEPDRSASVTISGHRLVFFMSRKVSRYTPQGPP